MLGGPDLATALVAADLIPGSVQRIDDLIEALVLVGVPASEVGDTLPKLDAEAWTGAAADAFRTMYAPQPQLWVFIGVGLTDMSDALTAWRDAVQHGQAEAWLAKTEWLQAQAMTDASVAGYYQQVQAHDDAISQALMDSGPVPPALAPFHDPGASLRRQAEQRLADARAAVAQAEATATVALSAAREALPDQPSALHRFGDDLVDDTHTAATQVSDAGEGAVDAVAGMVNTFRTLNPLDPQNMTHPGQYVETMLATGTGVAHDLRHPVAAVQSVADHAADEIEHDPGRFLGSLLPNVAMGVATDGAGEIATGAAETAGAGIEDVTGVAAAGSDTVDTAGTAVGDRGTASGGPAPHSTGSTTPWGSWSFGPAGADAAAASGIEQAGVGLGQVERDLAGVHVSGENMSQSAAPPDTQSSAGPLADRGKSGPAPASSVSRTTPWGSFGDWARLASPAAAGTDVTQIMDAADSGLAQVEDDLSRIHVSPSSGSSVDPDIPAPNRSVGGFDLTPPTLSPAPVPAAGPTLAARLPTDYTDRGFTVDDAAQRAYLDRYPPSPADLRWLDDIRTHWPDVQELTDSELLALHQYKTSAYELNAALRSGNEARMEALDPEIRATASALNKLPDYHGPVFRARGVNLSPAQLDHVLEGYEPGTVVQQPSFTSTDKQPPGYGSIEYRIVSVHGKDISPMLGQDTGVQEVLFPPGSHFWVGERYFSPLAGKWVIHLTNVEG